MVIEDSATTLSEADVERVSDAQREPTWLRRRRLDAWQVYRDTAPPTDRDEEWRRTDLRWVHWDALEIGADEVAPARPAAPVPVEALQPSVVIAQADGGSAVVHLSDEARAAGVVAGGLTDLARDQPDFLQDYLGTRAVTPDLGKFQALNAALWAGGAFVYVPAGVELPNPVLYAVEAAAPTVLPRLLVRLDEGASASVVEWWASPQESAPGFANGVAELFVGEGARLAYTHVQAWGAGTHSILSQRAMLGRDASLTTTNVTLGALFHKARVDTMIEGPGATVLMNGLYYLTGQQFVDHHTLQDHNATDSLSDLLFVGALDGTSRSVYSGTIIVERQAQRSNAYQRNRNLMLRSGPRADSIPRLEIMADDVRCTHGATTSTLDPMHLFYLSSRGLPTAQAEALIVDGIFEPVLERVADATVRDVLRTALQAKLAATRAAASD